MTNHEAALELIALAQRDGGLHFGTDWVPLDVAQAAFNQFIAYVPEAELTSPMTFGGKSVERETHRSWCEKSQPDPPDGFRSRICTCRGAKAMKQLTPEEITAGRRVYIRNSDLFGVVSEDRKTVELEWPATGSTHEIVDGDAIFDRAEVEEHYRS